MSALRHKLWRDLLHLRGQVTALALVLIGGIATLSMFSLNYQALSASQQAFYEQYGFADVFAVVKRAPRAVLDEVTALPGVQKAEARVIADVTLELAGYSDPITGRIVSLPPSRSRSLNRLHLREGRMPQPHHGSEVVLGEAFADAHGLRTGTELTAVINGRRQSLLVVGIGLSPEYVYQIRPGELFPDFARFAVLWMEEAPLAAAFGMEGAFNDLVISLQHEASEQDLITRLDPLLARYGGIGAHGRSLQMSHRFLQEELGQLQVMSRLFSAIFLGVSAFLLHVVLVRLIGTQRAQIAALKAFGYSRWQVIRHYAELVLAMVAIGTLPGLLLGVWLSQALAQVYQAFYRFPFLIWQVDPGVVLMAIAFAGATGIVGAVAGLSNVLALAPATAMRPEAPSHFRASIAERGWLGNYWSPAMRMVLRNLERRPLRSLLSVTGIGLAIGIVFLARFQVAAIEQLIEVQFRQSQREDLTVTFIEPAAPRALQELLVLPGVNAVEPFHQLAVTLRNGHRSYRTGLLGWSPDATLHRLLDTSAQPITLPKDGLLLTDYLAEILAVTPGQSLTMEFLDGRRETRQVTVAGLVPEPLGVAAYARQDTVHRWRIEAPVLSGAWLSVGRNERDSVIAALRQKPRIAAIADRQAMIASFRDTMAEAIGIFTLVATLLASSIAIGVVYNSARIILSERGRELASLRVLGYRQEEVRRLLRRELFALAGLAVIPGWLFGQGMCALLVWGFRSELYRIPMLANPAGFVFAVLVVAAATAVSTWLVRRRLDRLDLVAALKTPD